MVTGVGGSSGGADEEDEGFGGGGLGRASATSAPARGRQRAAEVTDWKKLPRRPLGPTQVFPIRIRVWIREGERILAGEVGKVAGAYRSEPAGGDPTRESGSRDKGSECSGRRIMAATWPSE